ncbi:MAG: GNAT family N-acetyltransferase [Chitinophagales bacterium]|nr:GNAT family N-acetyltransferase [Chitinophagales bacterium]
MELYLSEKEHHFVLKEDGMESIIDFHKVREKVWDYRHTFVPRALRGKGISGKLIQFALDYAREHGIKVIPTCASVKAFLEKHPEYNDVLN